jgi:AMP deaminase
MYYLAQIPMAMSPLSNNALFLPYDRNPFQTFFAVGMFVSLSTDDPLQFHMSKEPLVEEYAVATQVWRFSATDQAELCANSVKMSGFSAATKAKWIGEGWRLPGPAGNDIKLSNVPNVRMAFRFEALLQDLQLLLTRSRLV